MCEIKNAPLFLAKFKPNEDLKLKMEENFGRKEAKDLPLYAYGNKLSFYRLPTYPEENENRPQGIRSYFHDHPPSSSP